jgi:hypothetical protein
MLIGKEVKIGIKWFINIDGFEKLIFIINLRLDIYIFASVNNDKNG